LSRTDVSSSKSTGDGTPSSPSPQQTDYHASSNRLNAVVNSHRSGVDSPDRFATPYEAPPPLSQRHLIEAIAAVDIQEKEYERGERDEIRSGESAHRFNGSSHRFPRGRSVSTEPGHDSNSNISPKTSNTEGKRRSGSSESPKAQRKEGKAKAFAFFGQVRYLFM